MVFKDSFLRKNNTIIILLSTILISLPLKNILVSIATIVFVLFSLFIFIKKEKNVKKEFFFPILLFVLMVTSLLWTKDFQKSVFGLQKTLPLLALPLTFFLLPQLSKESQNKIFKWYSFSMFLFAVFYLLCAIIAFAKTNSTAVFFYNDLVPLDPGAIYMSVFGSFALFYFIQIEHKNSFEKVALTTLTIFIFLLSSKSIITIDFIIIVCYYSFFAKIPKGTKALTILSVSAFLFFSIFYIKEVKERFLIEYETAFVDNTLQNTIEEKESNIHNVSIKQALNQDKFQQNDFFPGTALRIYQTRIFNEMMQEQNMFLQGFGLEASQDEIRKKAKEHNLYYDYGEYNFHNQYIQTFAELGILGFLLLLLMLFLNIKNALINKDFLHIAFAITMIILFLSESFFCRQRGIIFFIVLYCLFNSLSKSERNYIKL